ncbi:MAG: SGNH/GDSL hydrolase family protein [Candidatus Methylacidiphilales bacterium]|nr:SGNH/GDSL hydrolase family protein [Candidatus Methylacidiphilales bacterium]
MKSSIRKYLIALAILFQTLSGMAVAAEPAVGSDLLPIFARAAKGEPLRYVALGGSITYGGKGWLGPWLREQFPQSKVTVVNSGIPATGSDLGVFRLERDVLVHQPDLVAIEFCVNDWGLSDEDAYRYLETIIVRIKSLPNAPAIVVLEAAANPKKVKLERHRKIAQHYGFLEVDLQAAVDAELDRTKQEWSSMFKDGVHPSDAGHAFYARVISEKLAPFVAQAKSGAVAKASKALPAPLSTKPLLLDAHMIELVNVVAGWQTEGVPGWPGLYFRGVISAKAGDSFTLPLRGTTFGLFYQQQVGFGTFTAAVDEAAPVTLDANVAHPYKNVLLANDLPFGEHVIVVKTPSDPAVFKPVKLGYVLIAGDSQKGK